MRIGLVKGDKVVEEFASAAEAAKEFNVSKRLISRAIHEGIKVRGKYEFVALEKKEKR